MIARSIPAWLYGAVVAAWIMFIVASHERHVGAETVRKEWAAADAAALVNRNKEIYALTQKQAASSAQVQLRHDSEMAIVRARLADAPRMRVPAFCKPAAASADTAGAQGSDDAGAGAGLLPERTDADIRSLIISAEESAATARAAQTFIRENGMAQ